MSSCPHVDAGAPKWMVLDFNGTSAQCRHADESIVASITNGDVELVTFSLMVRNGGVAAGMFVALPPNEARLVASGLLQKADEIDGGKGKQ